MKKVLGMAILIYGLSSTGYGQAIDCVKEQKQIETVIAQFEELQKKANAKAVLAFITPPQTLEERGHLSSLLGLDSAGPRLYATGMTAFKLRSHRVTWVGPLFSFQTCGALVSEERVYTTHGPPPPPGPAPEYVGRYRVMFTLIRDAGQWRVDKYSKIGESGKYSGWE